MRKARTSEAMCRQLQQPGHEAHVSLYAIVVDSFQQIRRTLSGRGISGPEEYFILFFYPFFIHTGMLL